MAVVDITMAYTPSLDNRQFGHYELLFVDHKGENNTIRLKFGFEQLWTISRDVSSTAFDFMVFSMAIYNTDRAINRLIYSFDGWLRQIHLRVPVLNLNEMNRAKGDLVSTLDFLTGDDWQITFIQAAPYNYEPKLKPIDNTVYSRVSLFSGGLDSLIGFIDGCSSLPENKKILLISHKELGKEGKDQERIQNKCNSHNLFIEKFTRVQINVGIKKHTEGKSPLEATFRARSILFIGAGIYCSHSINPQQELIIPENGTISLNIPLDKGRRSACSTRTTHPVVLKRLQAAFCKMGIQNKLVNPYQLKSKADMVIDCCNDNAKKDALRLLYKESCSCAKRSHKRWWKNKKDANDNPILHCGYCLPCIYRIVSLAIVGWDVNEPLGNNVFDPREVDLDNPKLLKNRDFKALLYFLKNRCNKETIESELIANGITDLDELHSYTDFVLHSYDQVKDWIKIHDNPKISSMGGL